MATELAKALVELAVGSGLRVTAVIAEPDGTVKVLTSPQDNAPSDPLMEARESRENKRKRPANGHKAPV